MGETISEAKSLGYHMRFAVRASAFEPPATPASTREGADALGAPVPSRAGPKIESPSEALKYATLPGQNLTTKCPVS